MPAERLRLAHVDASRHPRKIRRGRRPAVGDAAAPSRRGGAPCLPRSRRLPRRPLAGRRARRASHLATLPRRAPRAHRRLARHVRDAAGRHGGMAASPQGHRLPLRRRQRRERLLLHQLAVPEFRHRNPRRSVRRDAAEPRPTGSAWKKVTPIASRRASVRCTRSSPAW